MTGPGAAWHDSPARWTERRARRVTCQHRGHSDGPHWEQADDGPQRCIEPVQLTGEPGSAGERAGETYREPGSRPRQRGVRRVSRDTRMDGGVVERVEQLAEQQHGGNYSAALQQLVEAGLAVMDSVAQRNAGRVAMLERAGLSEAAAELDRLTCELCLPGDPCKSHSGR